MRSEWREVELGDVTDLLTGYPFKSQHYTDDTSAPKLLGGDNIVQGSLRWQNVRRWPRTLTEGLDDYWLEPGDVVLAMDRPWIEAGLKRAAVSKDDVPSLLIQRTARLRGTTDLDTAFLRYVIGSSAFTQYVLSVQTGTAVPHISPTQIRAYSFLLPPIEEQRAIAFVLGALDDKIELNRRMNATLEAMAQAVFKEWFVDGAKAEWKATSLGEHLEVVKGLSYKGSGLADAGRPMHNLNSIYEFGRYKYEGIKWYTGEFRERHNCKAGDVIVANTEQGFDHLLIGSAAIVPKRFGDEGIFSHHIYRVRPLPNSYLTNHFFYLLLSHPFMREQVQGYTNGTTVNGLAKEGLERPTFKLPPKALVEKFDAIVTPLFARQEANYEETQSLTALRDTLLPKLIRGEVRVDSIALRDNH